MPEKFAKTLEQMKAGARIIVVGDVMLDEYIQGKTDRISPEAPEPVILEENREYVPGGAANVAANIHAMGGTPLLFGVTGEDNEGALLRDVLAEKGIDPVNLISVSGRPTIRKTRVISGHQQVLRLDRETRTPFDKKLTDRLLEMIMAVDADGIVVSDYAKGTITARLMSGLLGKGKRVLVDPKGNSFEKYRGSTLLTPNIMELAQVLGLETISISDLENWAGSFISNLELESLLVTMGSEGMILFTPDSPPYSVPTQARNVFDVTGAGDTVIAALATAFFSGSDLRTASRIANTAAGLVVEKRNTAVVELNEIKEYLYSTVYTQKIKTLPELKEIVSSIQKTGNKVVFTNGCFDLLHVGHIQYLHEASRVGDVLIVAINSDASIRRIKGESRPIVEESERSHIIAALESVDYVIIFDEDTPIPLLCELKPDILAKGGDYTINGVVGRHEVEAYGGQVKIIPIAHNASTTKIIEDIIKRTGQKTGST